MIYAEGCVLLTWAWRLCSNLCGGDNGFPKIHSQGFRARSSVHGLTRTVTWMTLCRPGWPTCVVRVACRFAARAALVLVGLLG